MAAASSSSSSLFTIKCLHPASHEFGQHKNKKLSAADSCRLNHRPPLRATREETRASHNSNSALIHQQSSPSSNSLFLPGSSISLIKHIIRTTEEEEDHRDEEGDVKSEQLRSAMAASITEAVSIPDEAKNIPIVANTDSDVQKQHFMGAHCIWPRPKPVVSTTRTHTSFTSAPRCAWPRSSPPPPDGPKCAWPRMASVAEQTTAHGPRCPWPRAARAASSVSRHLDQQRPG